MRLLAIVALASVLAYRRREVRAMGLRKGVRPRVAAKVLFTPAARISTFAFGPVGGNPELCRPEPAG